MSGGPEASLATELARSASDVAPEAPYPRTMARTFKLEPTWRMVVMDLGLSPANLLARAGLPKDTLGRTDVSVTTDQFFALWQALMDEVGDPDLPLKLGQMVTAEMFSPPIFAALCSPDMNTAAERLSRFKALIGPFTLAVDRAEHRTSLTYGCLDRPVLPSWVALTELVFITSFVRMATRTHVRPVGVQVAEFPDNHAVYDNFFGIPIVSGDRWALHLSQLDAQRPFLTNNAGMWDFFEPQLRQRLAELQESASTADRVHATLLELLPSGRSSIQDVAKSLGMSTRTLQRRLGREDTHFQALLSGTREQLARHYLGSSAMSGAEISFLLGYDDPNSFFRAFHQWTGQTPETVRAAARG